MDDSEVVGKFPKEPDEGDSDVIDRNLAQQKAARTAPKPDQQHADQVEGLDEKINSNAVEYTKELP